MKERRGYKLCKDELDFLLTVKALSADAEEGGGREDEGITRDIDVRELLQFTKLLWKSGEHVVAEQESLKTTPVICRRRKEWRKYKERRK